MKRLSELSEREKVLILAILEEDSKWMTRMSQDIPELKIIYPKDFGQINKEMVSIIQNPEENLAIEQLTKQFIVAYLKNDYIWLVKMLEKLVWKRRLLKMVWKAGTKLVLGRSGFEVLKDVIECVEQIPVKVKEP